MMREQMFRADLKKLADKGLLKTCQTRVDPAFELGAVLMHYKSEQPLLFSSVSGYKMPVAGGVYGNRDNILFLLGTTPKERFSRFLDAIARPRPYSVVSSGPVQEKVVTSGIDIRRMLPVPTSNGKDSGPFLTAGMIVYKDPETGRHQAAVRRFQVNRGASINALVSPASPHLRGILDRLAAEHKKLECAVILGYDANLLLASQTSSSKYGLDTYEVDSALRGEPLELVRCRTADLLVPAQAEIVLEGVLEPGKEGPEGPFAELMGYYSTKGTAPLMDIKAVTMRSDAIFQHAYPCREEHLAYGMIKEAEAYAAMSGVVNVQDINYTLGGGCRLHAVISIKKRTEGDAKTAILMALGAYKDLKHVVVVDDDIDIYNMRDVEGAISSRFEAAHDLLVIPGAMGSPLEPSFFESGTVDKLGLDCTKPLGETNVNYELAVIPGFERGVDISRYSFEMTNSSSL